MSSLGSVGEQLTIDHSPLIDDLDWLSNLVAVGNDITIIENDSLPCCAICDLIDQLLFFADDVEAENNSIDECCPGDVLDCP